MAVRPQYLRIRNYDQLQHYKDRRPAWIKFYVSLLDDYELLTQDVPTRLLYNCLLLLAARLENNIPNDPIHIARQIAMPPKQVAAGLENLLLAGFLTTTETRKRASKRASTSVPKRSGSAMPEVEAEVETEKRDKEQLPPPVENAVLLSVAPNGALKDLGARVEACRRLLERIDGADAGTPKVVAKFCKQLPEDRIDRVTSTLRSGVPAGVAVSALKREVHAYEAEVRAEGAA